MFAKDLAKRWLLNNLYTYKKSQHMIEKYNSSQIGVGGGGGEYELQTGFGWSNGVVLILLETYPDISTDTFHN